MATSQSYSIDPAALLVREWKRPHTLKQSWARLYGAWTALCNNWFLACQAGPFIQRRLGVWQPSGRAAWRVPMRPPDSFT